jgi:hypothetical protein
MYFYAYSLGRDRIVMWGVFDFDTNEFLIDNACKWTTQLNVILAGLKANNFEFQSSAVKNNFDPRITRFKFFNNPKPVDYDIKIFKKFFMVKYALKYGNPLTHDQKQFLFEQDIVESEFLNQDVDHMYDNYYKQLLVYGNIITDTKNKKTIVLAIIEQQYIFDKIFNIAEKKTKTFSLITLLLIVFFDLEDYKIAKYLDFLYNKKHNTRPTKEEMEQKLNAKNLIADTFLYEFLFVCSEIINDVHESNSNVKNRNNLQLTKTIGQLADIIVKYIEPLINFVSVGVIGGEMPERSLKTQLEAITQFFETFVSKTKYSKSYYINGLKECPLPEQCDLNNPKAKIVPECDVYTHGGSARSKYDLT